MNTNQKIFTSLKYVFVIVPIVAGLDKFTNLLTDWTKYVNPMALNIIPIDLNIFMGIVGVIEILAGILVFIKPKIGSLIVSIWLILIALSLIISFNFVDIAVRDLVMSISAYVLYLIASEETKSVENN